MKIEAFFQWKTQENFMRKQRCDQRNKFDLKLCKEWIKREINITQNIH